MAEKSTDCGVGVALAAEGSGGVALTREDMSIVKGGKCWVNVVELGGVDCGCRD
jgi:hypothetical protein